MTNDHHDDGVKAFIVQGNYVAGADWRHVVNDLTEYLVNAEACFSSGEIARWMRIYAPDLRFSVYSVGEHVRDLFYSGAFGTYAMVPRETQGLGRTPVGVEVFVYAPDDNAGWNHEFEVDIPKPGGAATTYPDSSLVAAMNPVASGVSGTTGMPLGTATSIAGTPQGATFQPSGVSIKGSSKPLMDLKATVQRDARLQVPRAAFEAFVHLSNMPMKGGDPVWVKVEDDKATISTTDPGPNDGFKRYDVWASSGRVSFPSQTAPFTPGDVYLVNIDPSGLTVDLTQTV